MKKAKLEELALTMPSFIWLIIFFFIPTLVIFTFAFKPSDPFGGIGQGWTLENIYTLLDASYLLLIWRTVWLSVLTTVFCLACALPVGYQLARASTRTRQLILLLIIVPFWSSFLVRIFAWKALLHPEGFFKNFLVQLHLADPSISLLYNSGAVLLVMVYTYLPFAVLPIYASASKFNFQLLEAAADLGSTRLYAFVKVFLPSIRKGLGTATLMVFIPAIGAYVIPDLVGGTQSEMIGNKIAQRTFIDRNLPLASGLSALLSIIILLPMSIFTLIQSKAKKLSFEGRAKE
ncbi:Spermidine/putrescine transport system permease protein PotB|uniref:ABC transporter permease n=1 Tax=Neochlamydia sp. AcF84 TaxID=2315858 RepID=UPI0014073086|nr:ABC transporter permease [Neochlamydia sp. AcF84]NGY94286.1 Spermidine/putrescine transport system permease protein PotB [Neochlamydia sp. AcF84]